MSATSDFLIQQISESTAKALGLPVETVELRDGKVIVTCALSGDGAQTSFWKAVREQFGDD